MGWLLFLNVVMLTRLGYLTAEQRAGGMLLATTLALPLATLAAFEPGWRAAAMGAVLLAVTLTGWILERRGRHLAGTRSLVFLLVAAASALLLGPASLAPGAAGMLEQTAALTPWTADLAAARWQQANVVLFGLLVLTNEINLAIRFGFHRLNLEPKLEVEDDPAPAAAAPSLAPDAPPAAGAAATDERQYNAGRVIGILERYFIFVAMLTGADLAAVAVILAAKGFARFKQLDRREFAEYILIGTLASTLGAVLVARLVDALAGLP